MDGCALPPPLYRPRINRVRRVLSDRGVLAVAAVRVVPAAPFTVVNLVAGAVGLRFFDYAASTAIGLLRD